MLVRYLRPAARRERQRLVLVLEQHRRLRRSLPCESAVRWAVQQRVVQSGVGERKVPRVGVVEAEPKVRQQHALRRGLITQTYGTLLDCENECEQDTVSLEDCAPVSRFWAGRTQSVEILVLSTKNDFLSVCTY